VPVISGSESVSARTPTSATLDATVDPNNETTECHFQWGKTSVTEHDEPCEQGNALEGGEQPVSLALSGLTSGVVYRYRVVVKNPTGKTEGKEEEFAATEIPVEVKATSVTASTATVSGVLNPKATIAFFEPGSYFFLYGVSKPATCGEEKLVSEGPGATTVEEVGAATGLKETKEVHLTGLQPHAKYSVCLDERDPEEIKSVPVPFETLPVPPEIVTGSESTALPVKATEATLNAAINPNNQETKYQFEYSTKATGEVLEVPIVKVPSTPGTICPCR